MSVCKYKYIKEFLKLFYVYCAKTVDFQVSFFFLKISCNEIGLIINVFAQIIGWSGRKKSIESKTWNKTSCTSTACELSFFRDHLVFILHQHNWTVSLKKCNTQEFNSI